MKETSLVKAPHKPVSTNRCGARKTYVVVRTDKCRVTRKKQVCGRTRKDQRVETSPRPLLAGGREATLARKRGYRKKEHGRKGRTTKGLQEKKPDAKHQKKQDHIMEGGRLGPKGFVGAKKKGGPDTGGK